MHLYAIGDIHGQVTMLRTLLGKLRDDGLSPQDTLVFLGDYVDRGENSCGVIEMLLALRAEYPNTIFLRGNHEQLMLNARDAPPPEYDADEKELALPEALQLWLVNGGGETLVSYRPDMTIDDLLRWWEILPESHWEFVEATELEYITERYHFVHAGLLPPGRTWEGAEMGLDPRLWIREPFLSSRADFGGRVVVFGHTPQMNGRPFRKPNRLGLDTAAVFGRRLTAAALDPVASGRRLPPLRLFHSDYAIAAPAR